MAGSAADIVGRAKSAHIAATYLGRHGLLVDDKPGQDLPAGWVEVNLRRGIPGGAAQHSARFWTITGLRQIVAR